MLLSTSITAATLVLAAGVEVHGTGECPSSAAIVSKLGLLSSGGEQDDVARVDAFPPKLDGSTEVKLRLLRADASVVGDRRLVLRGSCEEMADTVATILAAWRAPPVAASTAPATAVPVREHAPAELHAWLGVGGGLAGSDGVAAAGRLELAAERRHARARVAACGQTSRELDVGKGTVTWRRTHAELGLGWQSREPSHVSYWQVSADADVLLGWLQAEGHGYYRNRQQDAFEYGLGAGLRAERRLGAWALWLEGRTLVWARPQRVTLWGSPSSALLPRFDALLTLGVSRLVFR